MTTPEEQVRPRQVKREALALSLVSGRLHARSTAPALGAAPSALPVLCVPGLSANARSFDAVATRLAEGGRRVVALDLRGRGRSAATAPGTFGWKRHAEDVLEAARLLAFPAFVLVGHSMGAFVSMQAAALEPSCVQALVLIDGVGAPEPAVIPPILAAVERLGLVYPSGEEYCQRVRQQGAAVPWDGLWKQHYLDELEEVPGGVSPRTSKTAVMEDVLYGATHDARQLWPSLRMPTLLVRATQQLLPATGFVVGVPLRDAFLAANPSAQLAEVDANHYGVMAHEAALEAIAHFVAEPTRADSRLG
jgi:pimeloyl-ACP methyl ester carboxylesterase